MRQSDRVIQRRPAAWWHAALPFTAALLLALAGAARHPIPSALAQGTATGRRALRPGERVAVALTFEEAGTVQAEMAVASPGARSDPRDAASGHEGHRR